MDKKQLASERSRAGRCIVCDTEYDNPKDLKRGLCATDYSRFVTARRQLAKSRREEFEQLLIEQGKLLPSKQGQRNGDDDVFQKALQDFLERNR